MCASLSVRVCVEEGARWLGNGTEGMFSSPFRTPHDVKSECSLAAFRDGSSGGSGSAAGGAGRGLDLREDSQRQESWRKVLWDLRPQPRQDERGLAWLFSAITALLPEAGDPTATEGET